MVDEIWWIKGNTRWRLVSMQSIWEREDKRNWYILVVAHCCAICLGHLSIDTEIQIREIIWLGNQLHWWLQLWRHHDDDDEYAENNAAVAAANDEEEQKEEESSTVIKKTNFTIQINIFALRNFSPRNSRFRQQTNEPQWWIATHLPIIVLYIVLYTVEKSQLVSMMDRYMNN